MICIFIKSANAIIQRVKRIALTGKLYTECLNSSARLDNQYIEAGKSLGKK